MHSEPVRPDNGKFFKRLQTMRKFPLLILGIDAADRHLIKEWAADGSLPVFARLFAKATHGDSRNATGMVAGTVWPTFYTGVLPGRTGRFRGTTQFVTGTYEHADIDFDRHGFPAFWTRLSEAGLSSTIVDAPYAFLSDAPGVTQVVDWCSHSAWKDGVTVSTPESLAAETRRRYGRDPVGKCDFATVDTVDDLRRFRDGLIERVRMRVAQTRDLLADRPADVFLQVFSECHCAGHQLWHLHDPAHPDYDPALVDGLGGDPLKAVYQAVDAAIGELLDTMPADATALVFCSHGIGPAYSGTHLLDEVLLRLEGRNSPRRRQGLAQAMVAAWTRLPQAMRTALTPLQKLLWPKLKANLVQPGKASRKYFEIIVNDASAGVRINLKGREPQGLVEPGSEYDEICSMLSRELLQLENPDTGRPLISRVLKASEFYQGDRVTQLPDLLVLWDRSGPIRRASGEAIGEISSKFVFANHRTGDHTEDDGLFFFVGPDFPPQELEQVSVADLAPTIAALLDVPMPDTDGKVIADICANREGTRAAGVA
jgi:predicted AlkP superfamily phosphohydrolase/phosphomutase